MAEETVTQVFLGWFVAATSAKQNDNTISSNKQHDPPISSAFDMKIETEQIMAQEEDG